MHAAAATDPSRPGLWWSHLHVQVPGALDRDALDAAPFGSSIIEESAHA